ncbi:MAG: NMD3-related protein, partial [Candidatus Hydrothermarchaeaceae archaeon]
YRGKWSGRKTSIEELLEKAAAKIIETEFLPAESKNNRVSVSIGRLRKSTAPVSAEISGTIYGASYSISSNSNIKAIFEVCARCSKMAGGYYEGVFQVRGDMSDEEKEKIKKRVSSIKPIDTFITDLRVLRYGIDFYLSSAKGTKKIARMLRSELGGSTIETSKLVGRSREGKDLHRVTVVLRLPERR